MIKKIISFLIVFACCGFAGTFSSNTGLLLTDNEGTDYDIDALIASGYHIMVHQTGST